MNKLAYREEYYKKEILNGKTVLMSPSPNANHNAVIVNLTVILSKYIDNKPCRLFTDGMDLYEKHGVKEYWIINPKDYSIEAYELKEGKYILNNIYTLENKKELRSSLLDGVEIYLEDIFRNVMKEK